MRKYLKRLFQRRPFLVLLLISIVGVAGYNYKEIFADALRLGGYRVVGIENGNVSSSATDKLPTLNAVKSSIDAAISEAEIGGGTTLTGWLNILSYGAVADGTSSGGTDNTAAINDAISACANNGVIYIPPGGFRHGTIIIPRTKKVHIRSYASHWTGTDTAFIWDGNGHTAVFYGEVNGTNQSSVNYSGLTTPGLYVRNCQACVIKGNKISGYQDAIMAGGDQNLTNPGNQYNKIQFDNLYRNYRGVHIKVVGNSWCNSNQFIGGQIACKVGMRFTKSATQTDPYNQNSFYGFGFEHGGEYPNNMDTAIAGEFANSNFFVTGRMEGASYGGVPIIKEKVYLSNTCNGNAWVDWFWADTWCKNMGNSPLVTGVIWSSADGMPLGFQAYGYPGISSSEVNGRIFIKAGRRTFTAAANVPSNVNITWEQDISASATSGSYTVPYGIRLVYCNNVGASNTVTLPDPIGYFGETIRFVRQSGGGTTTVNGSIVLDAAGEFVDYKSSGVTTVSWQNIGGRY